MRARKSREANEAKLAEKKAQEKKKQKEEKEEAEAEATKVKAKAAAARKRKAEKVAKKEVSCIHILFSFYHMSEYFINLMY